MRKPHQHEQSDGKRINCANPDCKQPFKLTEGRMPSQPKHRRAPRERIASREVQYARYLDCGPLNWDDK